MKWKRGVNTAGVTLGFLLLFVFVSVMIFRVPSALFTFWRIPHRQLWFRDWLKNTDFAPDVVDYPHVTEVKRGMTPDQVLKLVGRPTTVSSSWEWQDYKPAPTDLPLGKTVAHYWYYKFFGWSDGIFLRFGQDGKVVHLSCGHG
jgi:hypothetical protein